MFSSIVVLSGAGISAESGIKTFRDADGLWENHRIEEVASPEGFERNPGLVQSFYNQRRKQLLSAAVQPNPAHLALAKLEQSFSGDFLLVTQNIDDLHERAGSTELLHMHGELLKMRCLNTGQRYEIRNEILPNISRCECCNQVNSLRPDIVWFGEMPMHMDIIEKRLQQADLFIAIGTSGQVYPAAGFVDTAAYYDAHCIEMNLDDSAVSAQFHRKIPGKASLSVPKLVNDILNDAI